MKYHVLNNGEKIPALGLGTYQQNSDRLTDILYAAYDAGYRLIDTAPVYQNQKIIGEFIKNSGINRKEMFLTSKVWNHDHYNVRASLEKTLDELGTDCVDLFMIHWPATKTGSYLRAWEQLLVLHEEGLISNIGVSNFSTRQILQLQDISGTLPVVNQVELHLRHQQKLLVQDMAQLGIVVQSWSPLWTGDFTPEEAGKLHDIAERHNKSSAQIVLGWHRESGLCTVPKTSQVHRLIENIDIFSIEFSKDESLFLSSLNRDRKIMEYPEDYL